MEEQSFADLQKTFDDCQSRVDRLRSLAQLQQNGEALAQLERISLRLQQGPVRAVVLGVSSAGKSTVINAVTGNIIVPEGKRTTSPVPVWVRCRGGDGAALIGIVKNENGRVVNDRLGRFQYLREYCYSSTEAGCGGAQEKFQDLVASWADVQAPHLEGSGLTLIDTPGLGASAGDNSRLEQVLEDGCEILVVVYKTLQLSFVKDFFRREMSREDSIIAKLWSEGRVFFLRNSFNERPDGFMDKDDESHLVDIFGARPPENRRFSVSALKARLLSCGYYLGPDLLPQGFSEEDRHHASQTLNEEKEVKSKHTAKLVAQVRLLKKAAYQQPGLCTDLQRLEEILDSFVLDVRSVTDVEGTLHELEGLLPQPPREVRTTLRRLREVLQCQIGLQRFWRALNKMKDTISSDPWEVDGLLKPIREDINAVVELLLQPLNQERKGIEQTEYPIPQELADKLRAVEEQGEEYLSVHNSAEQRINSAIGYSEARWDFKSLGAKMYGLDELNRYHLISGTRQLAEAFLLKTIVEDTGPYTLTLLADYRLAAMRARLKAELEDPAKNPEISDWRKYFTSLRRHLLNMKNAASSEGSDGMEGFFERISEVFSDAADAGTAALELAPGFALKSDEKTSMIQYLLDKRKKILAGGIRGGWVRMTLYSNFMEEQLAMPLFHSITGGTECYMLAWRQTFCTRIGELYPEFREIMLKRCVDLGLKANAIRAQIEAHRNGLKQAALEDVDKKIRKLQELRI